DERPADAAPTAVGRDCQEVDLAVTLSGPEDPADESHDPFVDFGDGGIPTVFRGMQTGEVATVVLSPVTVPVGEDDVTDERAERVLVERFESVDRQLEKDREVLGCERTDVHGGSLSAESVKREPSFRDAMASLTARRAALRRGSGPLRNTPCPHRRGGWGRRARLSGGLGSGRRWSLRR